jgi:hypothetical protein
MLEVGNNEMKRLEIEMLSYKINLAVQINFCYFAKRLAWMVFLHAIGFGEPFDAIITGIWFIPISYLKCLAQ